MDWGVPSEYVVQHKSASATVGRGQHAIDTALPLPDSVEHLRRCPRSAFAISPSEYSTAPALLRAFLDRLASPLADPECLALLLPFTRCDGVQFAFVRARRAGRRLGEPDTDCHSEWPLVARPVGATAVCGAWLLVCSVLGCHDHDSRFAMSKPRRHKLATVKPLSPAPALQLSALVPVEHTAVVPAAAATQASQEESGSHQVFRVKTHCHELTRSTADNGWRCDGCKEVGGCRRGMTDFGQTRGVPRFRCCQCDYDLCPDCLAEHLAPGVVVVSVHQHVLSKSCKSTTWLCDGWKQVCGCLAEGNQTAGRVRYRCDMCDFDLCPDCLARWASSQEEGTSGKEEKEHTEASNEFEGNSDEDKDERDEDEGGDEEGCDEDQDNDEAEEVKAGPKDAGQQVTSIVVPVDSLVEGKENYAVVVDGSGHPWDCMLNQTNIGSNNNKFYVIQLLRNKHKAAYTVWTRWGRVGEKGQSQMLSCYNIENAQTAFCKKFHEKTANEWGNRNSFKSVPGKYTLLMIDYAQTASPTSSLSSLPETKLPSRLQAVIKLIFDVKIMESVVSGMSFDIRKQPLGKLTKEQILYGHNTLKEIEAAISAKSPTSVLQNLSSRFYTLIPHNFGRQIPPVIATLEMIKGKVQLLETLADVEIATSIIKEADCSGQNSLDVKYNRLHCDIKPLCESSQEWEFISKFVSQTNPNSSPPVQNAPEIVSIFEISRHGEADRAAPLKTVGNRFLLWHGSRITNFAGIISQGLRIAPPEAPVSGYRFGKGVYFADLCYMSAGYCHAEKGSEFLMLLVDVVLGRQAELSKDQYMERPLPGFDSTKALGKWEPDPSDKLLTTAGYVVPYGKPIPSGYTHVSCNEHEYVIYNVAQAEMKYLVHLRCR